MMKKFLLSLAAGLSLAATLPAFAGPHGMGGMGGPGGGLGMMMADKLKTELALNTAQTAEWDKIAANAKAARTQVHALHDDFKAAAKAEMANAQPDLAKLAAKREALHTQAQGIMKPIQTQKLAFYQSLSAEQKTKVRDFLAKRMNHGGRHGMGKPAA